MERKGGEAKFLKGGGGMLGKETGVLKGEVGLWDPLKNYALISLERRFSILIEQILPW